MNLNIYEIISILFYSLYVIIILFYGYKLNVIYEPIHVTTKRIYTFILSIAVIVPIIINLYILKFKYGDIISNYGQLLLCSLLLLIIYYKDDILIMNLDNINYVYIDTVEYDNKGNKINLKKDDKNYKTRMKAASEESSRRSEMGRGVYD